MRNLLLAFACLMTGCAASISAEAPCADPVTLPDRALTDQEIEIFWGRDRTALRVCKGRAGTSS
jgi:uncharacterized protein YceK